MVSQIENFCLCTSLHLSAVVSSFSSSSFLNIFISLISANHFERPSCMECDMPTNLPQSQNLHHHLRNIFRATKICSLLLQHNIQCSRSGVKQAQTTALRVWFKCPRMLIPSTSRTLLFQRLTFAVCLKGAPVDILAAFDCVNDAPPFCRPHRND